MENSERQNLVGNNGPPPPQSYPPANYPQNDYAPPGQYPPQNYMPPPQSYPGGPQGYQPNPQGYPGAPQGYPPQGYQPHPQGYPNQGPRYVVTPVQPVYGNAVMVGGPNLLILGDMSTEVVCPHCRQTVLTNVQKRAGNTAWIICLILCCFCFPFCIYPLICDPCLDTYHICPACQQIISIKTP